MVESSDMYHIKKKKIKVLAIKHLCWWLTGISLATDDSCFREEAGENVAAFPLLLSTGKKQNQIKMTLKIRKCLFLQNRIPRLSVAT